VGTQFFVKNIDEALTFAESMVMDIQ